ncbi:MAG: hypothetical protein EA398_04370 [Deltaproteobacteria bacterium]|nr:MAG: hypothetical protein EA398_04370 [Deltaproteobacteria bacterium]
MARTQGRERDEGAEHFVEEFLDHCGRLTWTDLPLETRTATRTIQIGALSAFFAGTASCIDEQHMVSSPSINGTAEWPRVSVPPAGHVLSLEQAIAHATKVVTLSHRMDSTLLTTAAPTAALAAWFAGQGTEATNERVLLATACAAEFCSRLGLAGLLSAGLAFQALHIHAAAVILGAGMTMRVPVATLAHALRIVLGMPLMLTRPAVRLPAVRALGCASAAHIGMEALRLARDGGTGAPDALLGRGGLFDTLGASPLRPALVRPGTTWLVESIATRSRPGSLFTETAQLAAASAVRGLHAPERGADIAALRTVTVHLNPASFLLDRWLFAASERPFLRAEDVPRSVRHMVALTLLRGDLDATDLHPVRLDEVREDLADLLPRIHVEMDPTLGARQILALLEHARLPGIVLASGPSAIRKALAPFISAARLTSAERSLLQGVLMSSALFTARHGHRIPGLRRVVGAGSALTIAAELGRRTLGHRVHLERLRLHELRWHLGARVNIQLDDGRTSTAEQPDVPGGTAEPLGTRLRIAIDQLRREASRYAPPEQVDGTVPLLASAAHDHMKARESWRPLIRVMHTDSRIATEIP